MKKHIVKIMMLLAMPALAVVSCDSYDRTEVEPTITVDYNKVTLFENETVQLTASPENLTFTWESSNPDIATVDANGLVTGVAEGAASVVAKAGDISFAVEIIVQKKVAITGVEFRDGAVWELSKGATTGLIISQIPSGGNDIPVTDFEWWSDNEDVARVSQSGVVKGINYGVTNIHYRRGPYEIVAQVNVGKSFPNKKGEPIVVSKAAPVTWRFGAYDRGGEGGGYHDLSNRNGGTPDVESPNGNVGYTNNGEWLCYTIDVKDAGTYKCTMTASSGNGAGHRGSYQWFIDQPNVAEAACSPTFTLDSNGGWGTPFLPAETEVTLEAGVQRLIFYMHNGVHNLFEITLE